LVAAIAPELMTFPLAATPSGHVAEGSLAPEFEGNADSKRGGPSLVSQAFVDALTAGKTVLAIGPGLGQGPETARFTIALLWATKMPVVIDADALNILAGKPLLLVKLAKGRTVVLTPHPGEMARLAGISIAEVQANRLEVARDFVKRTGVTLVLKGARTLIAHPDGRVAVNTTGNPGMAKGGSGDLLNGPGSGDAGAVPKRCGAGSGGGGLSARTGRGYGGACGRRAHIAGYGQSSTTFTGFSLSIARVERVCLVAGGIAPEAPGEVHP
jgi:hydroxyethylthiazole kinase-like uncharacterized protein yjeF